MQGWNKRVLQLFFVALAIAALAATAASAKTQRSAAGPLNIYGYGPGDDTQENRAIYAASQMTGTQVSRPAGNFEDQVFLTRLASGDVPDLVRMPRQRVVQYAAKGVLQPMDTCIADVKSQYRVGALRGMTYGGKVYGLPEFTNQITLVVNQSAFKSAGVPIAEAQTKSLKQLFQTTKKLVKFDSSGNLTRIGFDPKVPEFFPMWVKWYGKDILSKDGLKAQLNSKEAIAALAYAKQLIVAQGGWNRFNAFRQTFDWFGAQNPLVRDQIAFTPYESFIYNSFSNASPNVDLLAKFFTNKKGGPITMFSGNGWAVPKGSKNVADACTYMKQVTSTQAWVAAAKKRYDARKAAGSTFTGYYTANNQADTKVYEDIYQSFGKPQFDEAVKVLVASGKYGFELPSSPAGQQFIQAYYDAVNRVLTGEQTPKQALDQAQKEAQKAIDDNKA